MTGCYKCGSALGNEAKLCPSCNERKLSQAQIFSRRLPQPAAPSFARSFGFTIPRRATIIGACALLVLALGSAWVYRPYIRFYLGIATHTELYELCLKRAQGLAGRGKDPIMSAMVVGIGIEFCSEIKTKCADNPQGDECLKVRTFIEAMARQ